MVVKPAARSLGFGCPGLFLSSLFVVFDLQELSAGRTGNALLLLGLNLFFIAMWLPFVVRLWGTRLVVDKDSIELRTLFGLRRQSIARARVRRITVQRGNVGESHGGLGESYAGIPIAYYDIVDSDRRVWKHLSTWFWRGSDCERLQETINSPGGHPAAPQTVQPSGSGFTGAVQSIGCMMQGASGIFGFGIGAVFAAALFHVPMGRLLGAMALPGFFVGVGIGYSANLAGAVYRILRERLKLGTLPARSISIAWIIVVPVTLWIVVLAVASVIVALVVPPAG